MDAALKKIQQRLVGSRYHQLYSRKSIRAVNDRIAAAPAGEEPVVGNPLGDPKEYEVGRGRDAADAGIELGRMGNLVGEWHIGVRHLEVVENRDIQIRPKQL